MLVARGPSPSVEGDSPVWAVSSSSGKFWSLDELVRSNRFASLIGIAKLRFSPPLRCKVVIPITSPAVLCYTTVHRCCRERWAQLYANTCHCHTYPQGFR